jgi:hypothetical protein
MKNVTFKNWTILGAFSLLLLLGIVLLNACSQQDKETPIPQTGTNLSSDSPKLKLESTTQLKENDQLISKLKTDEDATSLSAGLGKPQWDQVLLASYEQSEIKALLVPLAAGKTMIAFFGSDINNFKTMVLEISDLGQSKEDDFSGSINFYVPSGELLSGANYDHGKLTSINNSTQLTNARTDVDWSCFKRCFQSTWPRLPRAIQIGCRAAANVCFNIFTPPPARAVGCAALAGCVGGYAAGCLWACR